MQSNDVNQDEIECDERSINKVRHNTCGRKRRVDVTNVKGKTEEIKEEEVVRLFSVNCNGIGPQSSSKIEKN